MQVLRQKMKIKRYKQARRVLDFFKRNFDFHEPYQVIGEGWRLANCDMFRGDTAFSFS